jgi:hypothetical protein
MVQRCTHWPPELQLGTKVPAEPAAALKAWQGQLLLGWPVGRSWLQLPVAY